MSCSLKKFKLSLFGSDAMFSKLQSNLCKLREHFSTRGDFQSNLSIINIALSKRIDQTCDNANSAPITQTCAMSDATQDLFISTKSALESLNNITFKHNVTCNNIVDINIQSQHTNIMQKVYKVSCSKCTFSSSWRTSPQLPTGKALVNIRVTHAVLSSGISQTKFIRFLNSTGIGILSWYRFGKGINEYCSYVAQERESSCKKALHEEIQSIGGDTIDVITDARHSTRRNSKYTDVICVGNSTSKVIENKVVTRKDDPCTQRHELIGTKSIYASLDANNVQVRRHAHDRNASINKFIREQRKSTINQNDTWHVSVSIEKQLKKISAGAKCREGKTWSVQLSDKVGPVKTHVQYSMRNCEGNKTKLISMLDNIVLHYENKHDNCPSSSRCHTDSNYVPSRQLLTDPFARQLLASTIKSFDVYKHPENYIFAMDTYPVESFNNTLNVFHDKRVGASGDKLYKMNTDLAICHWNENIKTKCKNPSFQYCRNILSRWISREFKDSYWRPF